MDDLGALIARVKREVPTTDRIPLRRSFKKLSELLGLNESYALIAKGQYDSRIGLVACTDRRVLFVDEGFVYGNPIVRSRGLRSRVEAPALEQRSGRLL